MDGKSALRFSAWTAFALAVCLGGYLAMESRAASYLSEDAEACVNCHVMESYYASWAHSSHARQAACSECHLPVENYVDKYSSKARDGFNHSVAFTLNSYEKRILISDDGARRVQENCVRCHASLTEPTIGATDRQHRFDSASIGDRKCWECHRLVPHGGVRSIDAVSHNLSVRWNRK
jgi:cytochrome c nitrite reductase small subunit